MPAPECSFPFCDVQPTRVQISSYVIGHIHFFRTATKKEQSSIFPSIHLLSSPFFTSLLYGPSFLLKVPIGLHFLTSCSPNLLWLRDMRSAHSICLLACTPHLQKQHGTLGIRLCDFHLNSTVQIWPPPSTGIPNNKQCFSHGNVSTERFPWLMNCYWGWGVSALNLQGELECCFQYADETISDPSLETSAQKSYSVTS